MHDALGFVSFPFFLRLFNAVLAYNNSSDQWCKALLTLKSIFSSDLHHRHREKYPMRFSVKNMASRGRKIKVRAQDVQGWLQPVEAKSSALRKIPVDAPLDPDPPIKQSRAKQNGHINSSGGMS
jgi:hypothetical protein